MDISQWTRSAFVRVMACGLLNAEPSPGPMFIVVCKVAAILFRRQCVMILFPLFPGCTYSSEMSRLVTSAGTVPRFLLIWKLRSNCGHGDQLLSRELTHWYPILYAHKPHSCCLFNTLTRGHVITVTIFTCSSGPMIICTKPQIELCHLGLRCWKSNILRHR